MTSGGGLVIRMRVTCAPYASDEEMPVRIVALDPDDEVVTELVFTPQSAIDSADSIAELFSFFTSLDDPDPADSSSLLADRLRAAAMEVLATRN